MSRAGMRSAFAAVLLGACTRKDSALADSELQRDLAMAAATLAPSAIADTALAPVRRKPAASRLQVAPAPSTGAIAAGPAHNHAAAAERFAEAALRAATCSIRSQQSYCVCWTSLTRLQNPRCVSPHVSDLLAASCAPSHFEHREPPSRDSSCASSRPSAGLAV